MGNLLFVIGFWIIVSVGILFAAAYTATIIATLITDYKDRQSRIFTVTGICLSLLLYGVMLVKVYFGIAPEYSTGERVGYIVKLSRKGLIWKTFEGAMQLGHGNQVAVQNLFEFCVPKDNQKLIEEIMQYEQSGKKVKVKYRQYFIVPAVKCENDHEIIQIEALE